MELTERSLRAELRDVDEIHRDGMATMATDLRELHTATRASRRELVRNAAIAGAAVTIGSTVLPLNKLISANAQELDDATIAAFAASVEYAAVAAYKAAAGSGKVKTPAIGAAATLFLGHHKEHGDAFLAASGGKWTKDKANPMLIEALAKQLGEAKNEMDVVKLAYDTENAASATYMFALGALQSADALKLTASILPIESAHAVVLAGVLGLPATDETYLPPFETAKAALSPTDFPLA
ncbi:MAG: ferritin-like domain-containing protein [Acidimicrobiales bacterium]|nr:ferritin-like domain-containing protein [Acidimicrobiales bacterium]